MSEFALIDALRARTSVARRDVALGIGDDAALLAVPDGQQLVACTDTLVAGIHFLPDTAPEDLGWRALAVNLSDLAAMGAEPAWALLALTLPQALPRFIDRFAAGFAELARAHGVALVGGDTTQGPLAVTVTALGCVPPGRALTRRGAKAGDAVFVTGTLGDAVAALYGLRDGNFGSGRTTVAPALLTALNRPQPRLAAGLALRGIATACIDVSDGLLADLGHVCALSGVGAELDADALPVSAALAATFEHAACIDMALAGGDNYELCFTAPAARAAEVARVLAQVPGGVTHIGRIVAGSGVVARDAHGARVVTRSAGWEHFAR
ncbi:MAG: thiamine-phosphate kinase [Rhodanobacteraceae bacterium]|nr:MAG: thiamine-phosphate kinase [Rhodanobacteraceae bacterium]